jgi:hypothetical protein
MLRSSRLDHQRGLAASLDRSFKHRRKVLATHACGGDRAKPWRLMWEGFDRSTIRSNLLVGIAISFEPTDEVIE